MTKWTKITLAALATLLILSGTDAMAAEPPIQCGNWSGFPQLIAAWNFEAEYTLEAQPGVRYTPMTGTDFLLMPEGIEDAVNIFPGKITGAVQCDGPTGYGMAYQFSRTPVQEIQLTERFNDI